MMLHIWKKHIETYPMMEIQDMLKLIYQSEFGGGHMIADSKNSLARIKKEYEEVKETLSKNLVLEQIGENMCRIYLSAIEEGLLEETLNAMFVYSANQKKGTVEGLEQRLQEFVDCCFGGELPFDGKEAQSMIELWKQEGYPAKSHSETYRRQYQPAYRVVEKTFLDFYEVFLQIDRCVKMTEKETILVNIDGMAGSGKSTLGALIKEIYPCNLYHMDDYFLQPHQRTEKRLEEAGGNVDYERFEEEVLACLDDKEGLIYQIFDCSKQELTEKIHVPYKKIQVVEGAYCHHPSFRRKPDLSFFMEIPAKVQKERIGSRNGEKMLQRFLNEWIPMEHRYFEAFDIRNKCIVINGN